MVEEELIARSHSTTSAIQLNQHHCYSRLVPYLFFFQKQVDLCKSNLIGKLITVPSHITCAFMLIRDIRIIIEA